MKRERTSDNGEHCSDDRGDERAWEIHFCYQARQPRLPHPQGELDRDEYLQWRGALPWIFSFVRYPGAVPREEAKGGLPPQTSGQARLDEREEGG